MKMNESGCNLNYSNFKGHYRRSNTDMIGDVLVKDPLVSFQLCLIFLFET